MLSLTPAQKVALGVVVVMVLAAGALMTSARLRAGAGPESVGYQPPRPQQTELCVHVVGAVNRPGMYRLPVGSRISDAIEAGGGMTANARPESVNLAAILDDGEQVMVGSRPAADPPPTPPAEAPAQAYMIEGSAATPPAAGASTVTPPTTTEQTAAAPTQPPGRICLNTATLEELQELPGVGPTLAARIQYYRHEHGGIRSFEELSNIEGIGEVTIERIRACATLN